MHRYISVNSYINSIDLSLAQREIITVLQVTERQLNAYDEETDKLTKQVEHYRQQCDLADEAFRYSPKNNQLLNYREVASVALECAKCMLFAHKEARAARLKREAALQLINHNYWRWTSEDQAHVADVVTQLREDVIRHKSNEKMSRRMSAAIMRFCSSAGVQWSDLT